MTSPATQHRIMARLVGAIYAIVDALFPVIRKAARQPIRSWQQNASYADRFSHIIQQLLALTARIAPTTLSKNPSFPPIPKRLAPAPKAPKPARSLTQKPNTPARPYSARQLAKRLEHLLRQLEQLAAEIGAALPAPIHNHIHQARTLAGCYALRPQITWERAG